jgi:cysteine desulfurase
MKRIYLDHHATTPLDPAVLAAMMPFLTERFGNAASRSHAYGWEAEEAVEAARSQVARAIGAGPREIVFTSGATESINLALKGVAEAYAEQGRHLVTTSIEHPATRDVCRWLEGRGWRVTYVPVDRRGLVDPAVLEAALTPETVLVSLLHGNNEIGTLQPITEIGRMAKRRGVLFHVDGAQAFGKVALDVEEMGIDLLSISAHKVYGPKGVGALYVRRRDPRVRLAAQMHGGGQERELRSGTLNVPGIVGLGKAAAIAAEAMPVEAGRLAALRDRLWAMLREALPGVTLNGHPELRLPGNLHATFDGIRADDLITGLGGIAASVGSACASATLTTSHVLAAIGLSDEEARGSVRFGLGRFTTEAEIEEAARRIIAAVNALRDASPAWALKQAGIRLPGA